MKISKLLVVFMATQLIFSSGLANKSAELKQQLEHVKTKVQQDSQALQNDLTNASTPELKIQALKRFIGKLTEAVVGAYEQAATTEAKLDAFLEGAKEGIQAAESH